MQSRQPLALTRAWFHGWCQCGGSQLQLIDVWPQTPYTICADCGYIYPHVLGTYYALHDTPRGRHYLSYRTMEWPYYLGGHGGFGPAYRSVWARIRLHLKHGGLPE